MHNRLTSRAASTFDASMPSDTGVSDSRGGGAIRSCTFHSVEFTRNCMLSMTAWKMFRLAADRIDITVLELNSVSY